MIDDMRPRPRPGGQPFRRSAPQYHHRPVHAAPAFRTPEQVAAQEKQPSGHVPDEDTIDMSDNSSPDAGKRPRRSLKAWLKSRTKKQWIILAAIAAVILAGLGTAVYFVFLKKDPAPVPVKTITKKKAPVAVKPATEPSELTGLEVAPEVNKRPVTAVMIENSEFARPQSALDQAGVVFEAVAEGGITRFCAIFRDNTPDYIGPVRSVRPYYIQWALGFDAAIAHVGGSGEALQDMRDWSVKDLDQFASGSYYHRIGSRDAPHNVYTSMAQLNDLESKKGYGTASFTGFARKKEQPSKTPNATSIDVRISGPTYNSHYDYDAGTNSYKRSQAGAPHMVVDQAGNQAQLNPKVVVLLTMTQGLEADDKHTAYGSTGTGHAYIFQDGSVTEGTWKKLDKKDNFTFTDLSGRAIGLNPGQTWVAVVGDNSYVTYK